MKKLIALFVASFAFASAAFAEHHANNISHDELKAAIASGHVALIDVNGTDSYQAGHIPGAIDFEAHSADLAKSLPADKNTLVVAYCGNERCSAYKKGVSAAEKLGYKNVKHYAPGIAGWKKSGAAVDKAGH